jgi:putative transposase
MARQPRCAVAGLPHLMALRLLGDVAGRMTEADRDLQLQLLAGGLATHRVALHAYCLGADRSLLLLTPEDALVPARLVQDLGRRLAVEFNRRHGRTGPLFSGRFRSTVLEPSRHLVEAMRFVEQLPLRHGETDAIAWRWSSAAGHTGRARDALVSDHPAFWQLGNTPFEREAQYRELLADPLDPQALRRFESALAGGWPLGDAAFLETVAQQVDRRLVPRPPGRPRKMRESPVIMSPIFEDSSLGAL